jgi:hypothetical protein
MPEVHGLSDEQEAAVRMILVTEISRLKPTMSADLVDQVAKATVPLIPRPKDGHTPTRAELQPLVQATVAAACAEGKCTGKTGAEGPKGKDGQDAPPPSEEYLRSLIVSELTAYCSQDSRPCQGAVGPAGPIGSQGPPGPPGPKGDTVTPKSIEDTDCVGEGADSHWTISYSDGTTDTASGPCKVSSATPPTLLKAGR